MSEGITNLMGPLMVKAAMTGHVPAPDRNRSPNAAPQGVYRCAGRDEWIAISILSNENWRHLCDLVGTLDENLDFESRQSRHDEIDSHLHAWTETQDKNELAACLQGLGIAAAPVRTVADGNLDPQLKARGSLAMIRHPVQIMDHRAHPHPTLPWRIMSRKKKPVCITYPI